MTKSKQVPKLIIMADIHGQSTVPLEICKYAGLFGYDVLTGKEPPPEIVIVGDLFHRGPHPDLFLNITDYIPSLRMKIVYGDHDIEFLSAMCGSLKSLAHELWIAHRYAQQDFYTQRGVHLEEFVKFAQTQYPWALVEKLQSKLNRTVKSPEELAAMIMWTKLATNEELRLNELQLSDRESFYRELQQRLGSEIVYAEPQTPVSELTLAERGILLDVRSQFLKSRELRECARRLFHYGKLLRKERKMLFVHAMFPMNRQGDYLSLEGQVLPSSGEHIWAYWERIEQDLITKVGQKFEEICQSYDQDDLAFASAKAEALWRSSEADRMFQLTISEWSPAYARRQMRTIATFFENRKEPEGAGRELISADGLFSQKICDNFGVDWLVMGHVSNQNGDIVRQGRAILADPLFAFKEGKLVNNSSETGKGAGLLLSERGLEVLKVELQKQKSGDEIVSYKRNAL